MNTIDNIELVDVIDLTDYGCCGYKKPSKTEGFQKKREWLNGQLELGLKFKILQSKTEGTIGFIEYIPGAFCWRAIKAKNYIVIHCLMSYVKKYQHQGYGEMLLIACWQDTISGGYDGIAVVSSGDSFMADRDIFTKAGFVKVDQAPPKFELLVKKLNNGADNPEFLGDWDNKINKHAHGLTIYYSNQCPMTHKWVNEMIEYACKMSIPTKINEIKTYSEAQNCPSPYGTFALIYNGRLLASRPVSGGSFVFMMNKLLKAEQRI